MVVRRIEYKVIFIGRRLKQIYWKEIRKRKKVAQRVFQTIYQLSRQLHGPEISAGNQLLHSES